MPFLFEDDQKTIISLDAAMQPLVTRLTTNFQNKINAIYDKLVSLGSTPAAKTPEAITNAIQTINDSIYAKLQSLGQIPTSKKVADLNAKIQALTEVTWTYTASMNSNSNDIAGIFQVRNAKELRVTSVSTSMPTIGGVTAIFYDAYNSQIGSMQRLSQAGIFTIPSNARIVSLEVISSATSAATVQWTYQTKVLR